jgi:hypothetical protein
MALRNLGNRLDQLGRYQETRLFGPKRSAPIANWHQRARANTGVTTAGLLISSTVDVTS